MSVPNGIACKSSVPQFLNLCQTTLNSFMVTQLQDLFYGSVHRQRVVLSLISAEVILLHFCPEGCSREKLCSFGFGCCCSFGFLHIPKCAAAKYKYLQHMRGSLGFIFWELICGNRSPVQSTAVVVQISMVKAQRRVVSNVCVWREWTNG